jgi:SAM-dependent methyltransferase
MKFPLSGLATKYLTGLKGVEIGGSAHNSYELDTINVDYTDDMNTVYKKSEIEMCGEAMPVDVVADGANLPFDNNSFDFVISSHMLEHHYDPIDTIKEWHRVARKYIFITVPRKDLTFDAEKPTTHWSELEERHKKFTEKPDHSPADDHWSVWDIEAFRYFCMRMATMLDMTIVEFQEKDDKVGNGMTVLFHVKQDSPLKGL